MEQIEKKFVCKYCNKRYLCGKSLGGHIRTHTKRTHNNISAESEIERINFSSENRVSGVPINGQSGYGLRENPKKTKRFVISSRFVSKQEMLLCKNCGKSFQSLKALCGHMACHSAEKVLDSDQSDTETSSPSRRITRSKRYDSSSFNGNYSSVTELEHEHENEQEDLAMCLIMLSRDKKTWIKNSVADNSSDNISVILETKSKSTEIIELSEDSDSGYFNNGPKNAANSDISVDKPKSEFGFVDKPKSEFGFVDKRTEYECLTCNKIFHSHRSLWGHRASHSRMINESTYESGENSIENFQNNSSDKIEHRGKGLGSKKRSKGHECPICYRMFKSGQALGGHKRSHFINGGSADNYVINQNNLSKMPAKIDLNLPAPDEEDSIGHDGFEPW